MSPREHQRVLAIYPSQRGFAFAVMEYGRGVIDWGESEVNGTDDEFISRIEVQIERYCPAMLAVEDLALGLRGEVARHKISIVAAQLRGRRLRIRTISRTLIKESLLLPADASKHDIAERLSEQFPEVAQLQPTRSSWKKDRRMNVFDAIALAVAALDGSS